MSPSSPARALALVLLVSSLSGCWARNNSAARATYAREVAAAQMRVAQLEETAVANQGRISQLEETIQLQGRDQAQRFENIDQVIAEVSRLRGLSEVVAFDLADLKKKLEGWQLQQERRILHQDLRLKQIEKMLALSPPPMPSDAELGLGPVVEPVPNGGGPEVPIGPVPVPEPEPELPKDAKGKLELAKKHITEGRWAVGRVVIQRALDEHKDDPLTAELRYQMGEAWLGEKNWKKAGAEYKAVTESFDDSKVAPWAMLRLGDCFAGLGQKDKARLFYDGVVEKYPKSDAAKDAKKRIAGQ